MFGIALSIVKLALFFLIYYIFKSFRWLRILVYIGALTNVLFYLSIAVVLAALCAPRDGQDFVRTGEGLHSWVPEFVAQDPAQKLE
ncbi:MAG: hypothetical protein Q9219_006793 [cf. Caloplaca sp. 3 TL-2023]